MTNDKQPLDNDEPNLGSDGTIPNTDDGIAVGHDPDGSHFNHEEDPDPAGDGSPTKDAD